MKAARAAAAAATAKKKLRYENSKVAAAAARKISKLYEAVRFSNCENIITARQDRERE